jgi:aspartate aminotransferase-like enzyme
VDPEHPAAPRRDRGRQDPKRLLGEYGIEILGGFGPLAGQILRIGLMGASSTRENVLTLLGALEASLKAEGHRPPASGPAAAEELYASAAAV